MRISDCYFSLIAGLYNTLIQKNKKKKQATFFSLTVKNMKTTFKTILCLMKTQHQSEEFEVGFLT